MPLTGNILPDVFQKRYQRFLDEQQAIEEMEEDIVARAKNITVLAQRHLSELREFVQKSTFETKDDEINFFKNVKPLFTSPFLCYQRIHHIELHRPLGDTDIEQRYLKEQQRSIQDFFTEYITFYEYQRNHDTYRDSYYYTRGHLAEASLYFPYALEADPVFSTGYDQLRSAALANDLVSGYLKKELFKLANPGQQLELLLPGDQLQWTASVIDFAEMIYGLLANGSVNNGKVAARTLARAIGKLFNVKVDFISKKLEEIRSRKKNRHPYHDRTIRGLELRMDEDDEHAL